MLDKKKFLPLNGNEIYKAHDKLHKQAEEKWLLLLDRYTKILFKGSSRMFPIIWKYNWKKNSVFSSLLNIISERSMLETDPLNNEY